MAILISLVATILGNFKITELHMAPNLTQIGVAGHLAITLLP
jgi:hypothetical protein